MPVVDEGCTTVIMPLSTWVLLKMVPGTGLYGASWEEKHERDGNSCKFLI